MAYYFAAQSPIMTPFSWGSPGRGGEPVLNSWLTLAVVLYSGTTLRIVTDCPRHGRAQLHRPQV
jgi:hypothetical protein